MKRFFFASLPVFALGDVDERVADPPELVVPATSDQSQFDIRVASPFLNGQLDIQRNSVITNTSFPPYTPLEILMQFCQNELSKAQQFYDSSGPAGTGVSGIELKFTSPEESVCTLAYDLPSGATQPVSEESKCVYADQKDHIWFGSLICTGGTEPTFLEDFDGTTANECFNQNIVPTQGYYVVAMDFLNNPAIKVCRFLELPLGDVPPCYCSGLKSRVITIARKAPSPGPSTSFASGNCKRRCGTVGWGRTFGYKVEEEESVETMSEDEKFFLMPQGLNMGWNMRPYMGSPFLPLLAPWSRPPPPPMYFNNPFYNNPLGPPTPGFYATPSNNQQATNNACMRNLGGSCRCSCDDDCVEDGDCCSDYARKCLEADAS